MAAARQALERIRAYQAAHRLDAGLDCFQGVLHARQSFASEGFLNRYGVFEPPDMIGKGPAQDRDVVSVADVPLVFGLLAEVLIETLFE